MIARLLQRLGLRRPPDPRLVAMDAMIDLILEEARRNPEALARVARQMRACGISAEDAQHFARNMAAAMKGGTVFTYPLGAWTDCDLCGGRGWYHESQPPSFDDYRERYCDCAAGHVRRLAEGPELISWDDACRAITGQDRKELGAALGLLKPPQPMPRILEMGTPSRDPGKVH